MSPTHKLTFVYSVFGARLVGDQKAIFICLCGGRVTTSDSSREGLRIKDSDHLYVYGSQFVTVQKERGGAGLPVETAGIFTHCAPLMATLSLFSYPRLPIEGLQRMLGFQSRKKNFPQQELFKYARLPPYKGSLLFSSLREGVYPKHTQKVHQ